MKVVGDWEKGRKGGGLEERLRDACKKNPRPLFLSADAGVHKFLIG